MVSIIETSSSEGIVIGQDSHLIPTIAPRNHRPRFDQNYGAMTMVMGYLPRIEQLNLQGLDSWWYVIGVARVQVSLDTGNMIYFVSKNEPQITAVSSETGECRRFEFGGDEPDFSNKHWGSCQVGQSRLFQARRNTYRVLKIHPSQRSFTIERSQGCPVLLS